MADIVSDLGVNLLEEEIDEVIFQTNQFLTDATFTGSQGPFWWFLLAEFWDCLEPIVNQLLAAICSACPKTYGTKTGQKSDLSIQRAACPDALFRLTLHPTPTKIQNCPVLTKKSGGNPLSSSSKTHRSPGSEYRERYSKSGTLILAAKKVENFSNFFFDGKPCPELPPSPGAHWTRPSYPFCRPFCHVPSAGIVHPRLTVISSISPDYPSRWTLRMPRFRDAHWTSILPSRIGQICHAGFFGLSAKQAFSMLITRCNTIIYACLFKE